MTLQPLEAALGGIVQGTLALAGAGKMGGALLEGWLDNGLDPARVSVVDPHAPEATLQRFAQRGVTINPSQPEAADTLVLAVKPQALADAARSIAAYSSRTTLLVSVVAGKTSRDLVVAFPAVQAVARAMPNTPAAIRRGITGVFASDAVTPAQRQALAALFSAVGSVVWLADESEIDAVTAVSGSGPAYVFFLTECLARAAESLGLSPDAAARLARATVEGAGALMTAEPDASPQLLRENVTSPGGTTAAALNAMMQDDRLQRTITEAVAAAFARAKQLAG